MSRSRACSRWVTRGCEVDQGAEGRENGGRLRLVGGEDATFQGWRTVLFHATSCQGAGTSCV
jgi:hypothetical protein